MNNYPKPPFKVRCIVPVQGGLCYGEVYIVARAYEVGDNKYYEIGGKDWFQRRFEVLNFITYAEALQGRTKG